MEPAVAKWWFMHLDHRIIQWTRQPYLTAIKVHPKPKKDSSACARKFCFRNVAMPSNQNNLKLPIDNYSNSTGSNNIDDDDDNNDN